MNQCIPLIQKIPGGLLESPHECENLLCKLLREKNFLSQTSLSTFNDACFSDFSIHNRTIKMTQVLKSAKDLMTYTDRDLFTVILRVLSYAYQEAPSRRDSNKNPNARIAQNDLLQQFSMNIFGHEIMTKRSDPLCSEAQGSDAQGCFSFFCRTEKSGIRKTNFRVLSIV